VEVQGVERTETASWSSWLALLCRSLVGGALIGLVGGSFRRLLSWLDVHRVHAVSTLGLRWWAAPLLAATVAMAALLARLTVRVVPDAAGSGIQLVEATWRSDAAPSRWSLVPAKYLGGLLGIGAGLALGREGPTVHMGAVIGSEVARRSGADDASVREAHVALGGAGLAVAFSAPLGGALFALEEVAHAMSPRLLVASVVGSATAVAVAHPLLPSGPVFEVTAIPTAGGASLVFALAFGAVVGVLGVGYNALILGALDLAQRLDRWPPEVWALAVGAVVGLATWAWPTLTGGGDLLSQRVLLGGVGVVVVLGLLVGRILLGPLSYSAGTPGGLFAPLLVVGALLGTLVHEVLPGSGTVTGTTVAGMALIGMTALFAASVRAPLTGVVLVVEMAATTSLIIPMLVASAVATVVAELCGGQPIYDALRARTRLPHPS